MRILWFLSKRYRLKINSSFTHPYFFSLKSQGEIRLINPHILFNGKHIGFKLNSDDIHVKITARDSLFLHISKRKVLAEKWWCRKKLCWLQYPKWLTSQKIKKSYQNLNGSSYLSCTREKTLFCVFVRKPISSSIEDSESISISHPKAFYSVFKSTKILHIVKEWKEKSSQERICQSDQEYPRGPF